MKSYVLLLLSITLYFPLKAQDILVDGYILTAENDTLRGKIVVQQHYRQVKFLPINTSDFKTYTPETAKGFSAGDKGIFISKKTILDSVQINGFFEILVHGNPMSLLKFENAFYVEKDTTLYLLDKKESAYDDNKIAVNKRYIGVLNYLMLDCEKVKSKINAIRFQEESLIEIVQEYNVCINPSQNKISARDKKITWNFGIRAGVMSSKAKVLEPYRPGGPYIPGYDEDFERNQTFYMGVTSSLPLTPHFSFNPEVNYIRRSSEAPLDEGTIILDATFLQFGLPIRYNFYPTKTSIFSLYGGFGLQVLLSNRSGIEDVGVKYAQFADISISGTELSVFGGAQMVTEVSKKFSFGLDLRYELAFRHWVNLKMYNMHCLSIGPVFKFTIDKQRGK